MKHDCRKQCKHKNVVYCKKCGRVHCLDCPEEWGSNRYAYQWNTYPYYPTVPYIVPYTDESTIQVSYIDSPSTIDCCKQ